MNFFNTTIQLYELITTQLNPFNSHSKFVVSKFSVKSSSISRSYNITSRQHPGCLHLNVIKVFYFKNIYERSFILTHLFYTFFPSFFLSQLYLIDKINSTKEYQYHLTHFFFIITSQNCLIDHKSENDNPNKLFSQKIDKILHNSIMKSTQIDPKIQRRNDLNIRRSEN